MGQFVLVVEFTLRPGTAGDFIPLIVANAKESLQHEIGCRLFDVVHAADNADQILLYEVYDDERAYNLHREMAHVKNFFKSATPMIADRKVRAFERLFDGSRPA